MRSFLPHLAVVALSGCLSPVFSLSQPYTLLIKDYTTQDGLPDSRVAPIRQDSKGYLWFGTQAGLTRYDGHEFQTFGGAKDIPGIFGRDIFEDHCGAIWFAYSGFSHGGLLRNSDGAVTEFSQAVDAIGGQAVSVVEDSSHIIWVGSGTGLLKIRFTDALRTSWTMETFPNIAAMALFVDQRKRLWIGTSLGELLSYHNGTFTTVLTGLAPSIRPYAMYETRGQELWVGGIFGVAVIKDGTVRRFGTAEGLPPRGVWCFSEDMAGNFWVGTTDGLYIRQNVGGSVRFTKERSFGDALVYDMCLDAEGNLWFASHPGLRKLIAAHLLIRFSGSDRLATPGFGPIGQRSDGTILFGSRNNGVFALRGNRLRPGSDMRPVTTYTVLSILPASPVHTWYGMKTEGVILQEGPTSKLWREYPGSPSLSVHCIARTTTGEMVFGSDRGLKRAGGGDSILAVSHPDLDTLVIFDMAQFGIHKNEYWLATNDGLRIVELEGTAIRRVEHMSASGLDGTIVYTVLADRKGHLWCGTDGAGLVMFDGTAYTRYTKDDGLVGERVYALAQDSLGMIWVGTSSGLSQFDGTGFRSLTYAQGFGDIGLHGLLADRDGFLWVSTFPGISKIRPQRFYKSSRPPPVNISDMQVDARHYSKDESITLDPDPAVITFRYAGLSFTDESTVRYRYRLDGFDREWSGPVTQREVRYTHLAHGAYVFWVLARSADGVWSKNAATLSFVILPPLWARWWFMAGSALLFAALAYGAYRYRLAKALQVERTRSRIAMDLHDDVGASLTRISMMTELAQRMASGTSQPVGEYLGKIGDTSRELIDALGDIVWSVDPSHDTLQDIIRRLVHFGEEVCEAQGIVFETTIAPDLDRIHMGLDRRRDVYLLCKEAIHNAVQHSSASSITLCVKASTGSITISISDNGLGFAPDEIQPGHGLTSMRERAARLQAQFRQKTVPHQGTTVTIVLKTA